jgi:pilus assembly protein CpaE
VRTGGFSPGGGRLFDVKPAIAPRRRPRPGLLLEGKLFFGHLDVLLNLRTHNTLADLVPHANALDEGLVRDVVAEHVSGIEVLLGPADLQIAQGIRPQDLFAVISSLQRYYDYIVIDAGSLLNDNIVTLLDALTRSWP